MLRLHYTQRATVCGVSKYDRLKLIILRFERLPVSTNTALFGFGLGIVKFVSFQDIVYIILSRHKVYLLNYLQLHNVYEFKLIKEN